MKKTIQAMGLAGTLMIAGLAPNPSRAADADDIARAALGAFAVIAIGSAISEATRGKETSNRSSVQKHLPPIVREPNTQIGSVQKRLDTRLVIPAKCALTRSGQRRTYIPAACLTRELPHRAKLPNACRVRLETRHGLRPAYGAACLKRQGYRTARRTH